MALILALTVTTVCGLPPAAPPPQAGAVQTLSACKEEQRTSFDEGQTLRLSKDGIVHELSLEEYLVGVVMSEMLMDFEDAALQAQAIASRTFALRCAKHADADVCADSGCCQAWAEEAILKERCGADYERCRRKAQAAVEATDGLVLMYEGKLIDATFFSCSGGMTEDAVAVWGSEVPYLRSVPSPGEEEAKYYHTQQDFSPEEFSQRLQAEIPELTLSAHPSAWLGETERTPGDGLAWIRLGSVKVSGVELRRIFALRSTKFTLTWEEDHFHFEVYGYGHRVGMSQHGAQAMAKEGADAQSILETYYTGAVLVSMGQSEERTL